MILRYFYDDTLAQASWLLGCAATKEALVVDPARAIAPYLAAAEKQSLRITHITETHIHADFVSGSRELAAATGAQVFLSREGGDGWQYGWAHEPNVTLVGEGDGWMVGNIRIDVLHTPGHTPEHISFLVTDTAATQKSNTDAPIGICSGDFLFAGDVGRPDLLERAAGMVGTKEVGARDQFRSVQLAKHLPDFLQIWPGHGAGSACGKALGAVPSTTIGYERLFSPAFQFQEEEPFVQWLLADQPDAPRYFARMKQVNREGPALLATLPTPALVAGAEVALDGNAVQLFDLRPRSEFAAGHRRGAISLPTTSTAWLTWLGWFADYGSPAWFVLSPEMAADATALVDNLRSIGIDQIGGILIDRGDAGEETLMLLDRVDVERMVKEEGAVLLDLRNATEIAEEPDPLSMAISLGQLGIEMERLPRDRQIITRCASGYRSQIAASLLKRAGFTSVALLRQE